MLTVNGRDGMLYLANLVEIIRERGKGMKSTGVVRKVDELGRVVIPIELRRTLGIAEKDALEIYVDQEKIILKKYEPACIFCGNADNITHFRGKNVCEECAKAMAREMAREAV
jgi:transcriptional pleiotropic regulator of transition state genes